MIFGFSTGQDMLETTLSQLEQLIDDLLQKNHAHQENIARLEGELRQLRDDNDNLQLTNLEQEEQLGATLARLQAMLQRSGIETTVTTA